MRMEEYNSYRKPDPTTKRNLAEIKQKTTDDPQNRIFQICLEDMINSLLLMYTISPTT